MIVGSLGDIIFETSSERILTPSSFSLGRAVKYEDHDVQGTFPASEYVAPELGTCKISMTLRRDMGCDPVTEAERLQAHCLDGHVLRLIVAGKNLGMWTIRNVDQSWRHMLRGAEGPLSITIDVSLKEYF